MDNMYTVKKSYESRRYTSKGYTSTKSSPLGHQVDHLKTRKLPGHHKADPHTMIPHPRGCGCYVKTENRHK